MTTKPESKQLKYPAVDEMVVATVSKVEPYGAFVKLDEYEDCSGMVHISEISSKWVRNIRDYVKDGQKTVLKVLKIDREKGHIDLSLKSVKPSQRKETLDLYKKEQRAKKLIELAGTRLNEKEKVNEIIEVLYERFNSLYKVLESSLTEGENVFAELKISDEWKKSLAKIAKEYIEIPYVAIKANLELQSKASNGIEIIKNSILKAQKSHKQKDVEIEMKYLGAPKYRVKITAPNYKIAEHTLEKISNDIFAEITKAQGSAKLVR